MTDLDKLAKSLTKAQRKSLLMPRHGAWSEREQQGLPHELFGAKWCGFAHLSATGLALRNHLKGQNDGQ